MVLQSQIIMKKVQARSFHWSVVVVGDYEQQQQQQKLRGGLDFCVFFQHKTNQWMVPFFWLVQRSSAEDFFECFDTGLQSKKINQRS